jgi:hypothetical protein
MATTVNAPAPATAIVNPTSLDFGDVGTGFTSIRSFTVTNTGELPLTITRYDTSDYPPGQFYTYSGDCHSSLAAGATCTIQMAFAPSDVGKKAGIQWLYDNAGSGSQSVNLSGNGVGPAVSLSTTSIDFGTIESGTSTSRPITLTNTGLGKLHIMSLDPIYGNGHELFGSHDCPDELWPNASCIVTAWFSPTGAGDKVGTLSVNYNSTNSPQVVQLKGSAYRPQLQTTISHSTPMIGGVVTFTIDVTNVGTTVAHRPSEHWLSTWSNDAWIKATRTTAPFNCNQTFDPPTVITVLNWNCALLWDQTLQPGQSTRFEIDVQLPNHPGSFSSTVNTQTADYTNVAADLHADIAW